MYAIRSYYEVTESHLSFGMIEVEEDEEEMVYYYSRSENTESYAVIAVRKAELMKAVKERNNFV